MKTDYRDYLSYKQFKRKLYWTKYKYIQGCIGIVCALLILFTYKMPILFVLGLLMMMMFIFLLIMNSKYELDEYPFKTSFLNILFFDNHMKKYQPLLAIIEHFANKKKHGLLKENYIHSLSYYLIGDYELNNAIHRLYDDMMKYQNHGLPFDNELQTRADEILLNNGKINTNNYIYKRVDFLGKKHLIAANNNRIIEIINQIHEITKKNPQLKTVKNFRFREILLESELEQYLNSIKEEVKQKILV